MADASDQLRLKLPRPQARVDIATVAALPSMTRAIVLCAELAGLENSKDQARAIDIDPSQWSIIKDGGNRYFPQDKYLVMFDEFGNELPMLYLLYQRGYDLSCLRKRETETELELRKTREALAQSEEKRAYAESLLTGRAR